MKTDAEIKKNVEEALKWTPDLDPTDIAVTVKDGVVTLAGFVHTYVEKSVAEAAAKRVAGVVGAANDLEVRLRGVDERPDPEIARTPWPRSIRPAGAVPPADARHAQSRGRVRAENHDPDGFGSLRAPAAGLVFPNQSRRQRRLDHARRPGSGKRKKQSATSKALSASVISLK